ncbi:myelin and lymphocyte protein-like [Camelus ferus]|uniref:Myelin and lymphocyte protein-like n=1 Tax=Camelus ferus TaxID=419612 RepID=A0A8B8S750_CAMFR|nr:myelin and lymphocyte protein-like [Camelus ferus]
MFVSVFCFVTTTLLLFLYVIGAHGSGTFWITLDAAYHCVASLFYFGASVLEAFATIQMQDGFRYKQYHENISAVEPPLCTDISQAFDNDFSKLTADNSRET